MTKKNKIQEEGLNSGQSVLSITRLAPLLKNRKRKMTLKLSSAGRRKIKSLNTSGKFFIYVFISRDRAEVLKGGVEGVPGIF